MPELPEVETIRRNLQRHLCGARIRRVSTDGRLRQAVPAGELQEFCAGREVAAVDRRAKYLVVAFAGGTGLLLHLGMTGALLLTEDDGVPARHEHVGWSLEDGRRWRFVDPRRFGSLRLIPDLRKGHPILDALGVEPLSEEFSGRFLRDLCEGRTAAVKSLLMDQRFVVGVGNIYANEALFRSGIDPAARACDLTPRRLARLAGDVQDVLREAIAEGGTTISDYRQPDGSEGRFRLRLNVYGRDRQPCPRCGAPIRRILVGGRATFFCPRCQKGKRRPAPPGPET